LQNFTSVVNASGTAEQCAAIHFLQ